MKLHNYTIILFYKFAKVADPQRLKLQQQKLCQKFDLRGRVIIAGEGINATLEGQTKNIRAYIKEARKTRLLKNVVFKQSEGTGTAFPKLKIKVRSEIVTLGAGRFNVAKETAKSMSAKQLEALYKKKEDFLVLDLRNDYEIQAGYFENTVNPGLRNFRDLPKKIKSLAHLKHKKLVAVCTGGIRCEKATCLLKKKGFTNVYQLKDGIHTYIKEFPGKRFLGSLFVFDNRLTTPVLKAQQSQVVGRCHFCRVPSETFYSDDHFRPSKKVICCDACIASHSYLRSCVQV